jgi:hypothetical protein
MGVLELAQRRLAEIQSARPNTVSPCEISEISEKRLGAAPLVRAAAPSMKPITSARHQHRQTQPGLWSLGTSRTRRRDGLSAPRHPT